MSRQLVGAVEAGRHLPRIDAALALADALGVDVGVLFRPGSDPVDVLTGRPPRDGTLVRIGRVGGLTVTAPVRVGADGWDVADGVVEEGRLVGFGRTAPGPVVAGCEPGLAVIEGLLRERGRGAVAVAASSAAAVRALRAGRIHIAVVHGPTLSSPAEPEVARFRLTSWQVGLAAPPDADDRWWQAALAGGTPVVQREGGAGVQQAFLRAVGSPSAEIPGPRVATHLEAARRAVLAGLPAVTIEPAALAVGALFHPLELHQAEMWVRVEHVGVRPVAEALDVVADRRFRRRLEGVGGYDLTGMGTRVA